MQKHCDEADEKLLQSEINFCALRKDWERQCQELKFANKLNEDALEKTQWQENQIDKGEEKIEQLEKEKQEAIALYNVEQCRAVHFQEAYFGLVKQLKEHKYDGCKCMLVAVGAIMKSEKHLGLQKWDMKAVSQVIKLKQDSQALKRQREVDKKRIEDLEKRLDEFEKGRDQRVLEKNKEIQSLEAKLQEALMQIDDYRTFDKKDEAVLNAVKEYAGDGLDEQQKFHKQVTEKLDKLME